MRFLKKYRIFESNDDIVALRIDYIDYKGKKQTGTLEVNKDIAEFTSGVFDELYRMRFPINKISKSNQRKDEDIITDNLTTGYNYRYIMGTNKLSKHATGFSIDLNPKVNPAKPSQISHVYDETTETGRITPEVVEVFKKWGFKWGGEIFDNFYDPHHFEV